MVSGLLRERRFAKRSGGESEKKGRPKAAQLDREETSKKTMKHGPLGQPTRVQCNISFVHERNKGMD